MTKFKAKFADLLSLRPFNETRQAQASVPVYTTEGGWLHLEPKALVEDALQAKAAGFGGSKIKIGRPPKDDVKRLAAVREAGRLMAAGVGDALVTAPVSKEALRLAGYPWPGQTEMLADLFGPLLQVGELDGLRVADIGSGTGRIVNMLLAAGVAHVHAVEPSAAMSVLQENTAAHSAAGSA